MTATVVRTKTVALPMPAGQYRGEFAGGASVGSSGSSQVDEMRVWIDQTGELTSESARELAAALLAAADAVDVENGVLRGAAARFELLAWNASGPGICLTEDRTMRLRVGDKVADLGNRFSSRRPGIVTRIDPNAELVEVNAAWRSEAVVFTLNEAGSQLYLA